MKIGIGKRILMFLHWFFSLIFFAVLVISVVAPYLIAEAKELFFRLLGPYGHIGSIILGAALAVIYVLLCVVQAGIIFKRRIPRSERGFITVDSSDNSRVRIAVSAIEQMVRQSVYSIDGISDMKIAIENSDDAIEININASILSGSHVPTITLNMQQAIRKFVEMNCGVAVRTVAVSINSVTSPDAAGRRKHRAAKNAKPEETCAPAVPVVYEAASAQPVTIEEKTSFIEQEAAPKTVDIMTDAEVSEVTEDATDEIADMGEADESGFDADDTSIDKQE